MTQAAAPDRITAELVRIQYRQMLGSEGMALLVVLFVAIIVWLHSPGEWVFLWAGVYAAWMPVSVFLVRRFQRAAPAEDALPGWSRAAAATLAVSGLIWGVGFYHFIDPAQPLAIGLLICAMAGLTSGSIGFRSTILPGFYAFNLLVATPMALRFFQEGGRTFLLLGCSTLVYILVIAYYGHAQNALIRESLAMRFSNADLVEALRFEKRIAEAARADAERADLAKSQFLAAASHDLRQPLYALGLFSGSLGELRLDDRARAIVGDIQNSIAAMEGLFSGLLDISRLDAGVVEPQFEPVAVGDLFDRISRYSRPIAIERGLDLRFRSDGEWVISDPTLLEQVLGNLVSNSLRWTRRGGVLVAARRRVGSVSLEVWDTGVGISPQDLERIFDDFVQLDNASRDRGKGLGLGLSIAKRAASLIGATIAVASRQGVGSRFSLTQSAAPPLPGRPRRDAALAWTRIEHDSHLPILVVDDDPDIRAALALLLGQWGRASEIVADIESALAAMSRRRFGLILCDYRLEDGLNGFDLLTALAGRSGAAVPPAILITGDVGPDLVRRAHAHGVVLLHKPVRADDLAALLGVRANGFAGP